MQCSLGRLHHITLHPPNQAKCTHGLRQKIKTPLPLVFNNTEILSSPCRPAWRKLGCGELCLPRLSGWLRLQRWAPPARKRLLCLLKGLLTSLTVRHVAINFHSPYQINEVCGHRTVWVSDSNALWSPYVFGSIS